MGRAADATPTDVAGRRMTAGVPSVVADREIVEAVAAEATWMEELLARLVAAPTVLGNEAPGIELMGAAFAELGLDPVEIPLDADAIRAHPGSSPFSWDVSGKRNVIATWPAGADGGRSLILNGHVDVVPPAAEARWSAPPFEPVRDGDWLYGRGAGDMKAGLAAVTGAVRALQRLGLELRAPLHLEAVVEEESTGNGALQCVIDGPRADACVITEPHPDHIATAQVGVLWFHLDISGAAAHAGGEHERGSVIESAAAVIAALRELEAELNRQPPPPFDRVTDPIRLNPGVIEAGDWPSTVAAECTVSLRLSTYPELPVAELRRRVEQVVTDAANADPLLGRNPPRLRFDGFACDGFALSDSEPVVVELGAAYRRLHGELPALVAATATTDARHFVQAGIPTVCFGPCGQGIHGIDERVSLRSMLETAQVLALFVRDWCGIA